MAELVKPQYHSKSSYPSSRASVYNVAPAQEKYRGPDESAGHVDLSTAKIFDELQDGLSVFGEIYAQSEKTAEVLQAKSLLVKKMKDTQRITELLATELPNTGYEHLKLKSVLDKYKARDLEGKTDLLKGLKENVIIGRLIPAGTGTKNNQDLIVTNPTSEEEKQAVEELENSKQLNDVHEDFEEQLV